MELTMAALAAYLQNCRSWQAVDCLVVGHAAPDADAVVSALFEGWRRYLVSGERAVPVVQAAVLPREVVWLLGELAQLVPTEEWLSTFTEAPVVLTDHHTFPERKVLAVVDHHLPAQAPAGASWNVRAVGATVTLVAASCLGQGLLPDAAVARLLLGGILLDTEGLSSAKAKEEDRRMAAFLAALAATDGQRLFAQLQEQLLAEGDIPTLYRRDYRQYERGEVRLGFAILKVWQDAAPDLQQVRQQLRQDAQAGQRACVAKVALYGRDGTREEHYLAFGEESATACVLDTIMAAGGAAARRVASDEVYLPAEAVHPGRKALAPCLLEALCRL